MWSQVHDGSSGGRRRGKPTQLRLTELPASLTPTTHYQYLDTLAILPPLPLLYLIHKNSQDLINTCPLGLVALRAHRLALTLVTRGITRRHETEMW